MPFSENKIIRKIIMCHSLQVQRPTKVKYKKRKRVFLSISKKGSITIEASIVLPIFLMFMISIMSLFIFLDIQQSVQIEIDNLQRYCMRNAYYVSEVGGLLEDSRYFDKIQSIIEEKITNDTEDSKKEERINWLKEGTINAFVYGHLINNLGISNINKSYISNGALGINVQDTNYSKDGVLDIIARYSIKVPFVDSNIMKFRVVHRARAKVWVGNDITVRNNTVYITKSGTVYHTCKECRHIDFNIRKVEYKEIESLRNASGGKYYGCTYCGKDKNTQATVFITDYGERYHITLACSALTRSVIAVDKSQIGDRKQCKDCIEKNDD